MKDLEKVNIIDVDYSTEVYKLSFVTKVSS